MRYAIVSDIHSNLEALTAAMHVIDGLKVSKIFCLGDIVGYNANPNECIDILRERGVKCVMGNHDERAVDLKGLASFNQQAENAIRWTHDKLTDESKEFLRELPRFLTDAKRFLAVHGSIGSTDAYILCARDAAKNFAAFSSEYPGVNVCFYGHTHIAMAYLQVDGSVLINMDNEIKLDKGALHLVNPGSIGQPRNRDPRASFVVYDTAEKLITYHKVEYDISATAAKIIAAGLPERLAERLKLGW